MPLCPIWSDSCIFSDSDCRLRNFTIGTNARIIKWRFGPYISDERLDLDVSVDAQAGSLEDGAKGPAGDHEAYSAFFDFIF